MVTDFRPKQFARRNPNGCNAIGNGDPGQAAASMTQSSMLMTPSGMVMGQSAIQFQKPLSNAGDTIWNGDRGKQ